MPASIACVVSGFGVTSVRNEQDLEALPGQVRHRRGARDRARGVDAAIHADGALIAVALVRVELERALADLLDDGLVGLARDVLDQLVEARDVPPLARHDVIERAEDVRGEARLRKRLEDCVQGLRHVPRPFRSNVARMAFRAS